MFKPTDVFTSRSEAVIFCGFFLLFEPVHEISNNLLYMTSKASDQPAHTRSPIRALLVA